jgi:hypothetical protein
MAQPWSLGTFVHNADQRAQRLRFVYEAGGRVDGVAFAIYPGRELNPLQTGIPERGVIVPTWREARKVYDAMPAFYGHAEVALVDTRRPGLEGPFLPDDIVALVSDVDALPYLQLGNEDPGDIDAVLSILYLDDHLHVELVSDHALEVPPPAGWEPGKQLIDATHDYINATIPGGVLQTGAFRPRWVNLDLTGLPRVHDIPTSLPPDVFVVRLQPHDEGGTIPVGKGGYIYPRDVVDMISGDPDYHGQDVYLVADYAAVDQVVQRMAPADGGGAETDHLVFKVSTAEGIANGLGYAWVAADPQTRKDRPPIVYGATGTYLEFFYGYREPFNDPNVHLFDVIGDGGEMAGFHPDRKILEGYPVDRFGNVRDPFYVEPPRHLWRDRKGPDAT